MRKLILLLLFPALLQAQSTAEWLTPIANIGFEGDKIIYRYNGSDECAFVDLTPKVILSNLEMIVQNHYRPLFCDEIIACKNSIINDVASANPAPEDIYEKIRFVRAFVLQTIWATSTNQLPGRKAIELIENFSSSSESLIKQKASLALDYYRNMQGRFKANSNDFVEDFSIADTGISMAIDNKDFHHRESIFDDNGQKTEVYYGEPNRLDWARGLNAYYDRGYLLTGGIQSGGHETVKGWEIKIDINMTYQWDKVLDFDPGVVGVKGAILDQQNNMILFGIIEVTGQPYWPFIAMFDPCGQQKWCKILKYDQEFNYGHSVDIVLGQENELIVLASFDSEEEIDMIHLICLDSEGNVLWKKPYASKNNYPWLDEPVVYSLHTHCSDYYTTGYCYYPYPNDTTHFFLRPFFIGIDSAFNEKWILPFAPLDSVYGDAYDMIAINDSILMGIGERWLDNGSKSSILMFFSDDGETLGYNEIPNDSIAPGLLANVSRGIQRVNDSLFITRSIWGTTPDDGICSEMIIDTSGKVYKTNESSFCLGSGYLIKDSKNHFVYAIDVREENTGWDILLYKRDQNLDPVPFDTTTYVYDSLCPGGVQPGTIDLSDCLVWTGIEDTPTPAQYYESIRWIPIKAYPNPVTEGKLTLEFENTEHHQDMQLRCYDDFGRQIHHRKIYKGQQDTDLDVSGWPPGIYIAVVYSDGSARGKAKFVVR